jgi:cytochrome d ubiquinol oxidase subunit II
MEPSYFLTIIWALIIGAAVLAYVIMDGFDLGIGILFPGLKVGSERDQAMNSIAPVWDGNETWLVLGGGGLLAAFPLAYAIIMSALYPPIIAMLLGLVFRGVAFEFRWRDPNHRAFWDLAFSLGSLCAAFCQGIILGALLQGIHVEGRSYAGGWLDWLSPFSLLCGTSVVVGYVLLGSTWLIWKTEGTAQVRARILARQSAVGTLIAMVLVSLATPFLDHAYWERWFELPGMIYSFAVPFLTALTAFGLFRALWRRDEIAPFIFSLGLFVLGFIGLGISMYPFVIPDQITIWDAATSERGQIFMLIGVGLTLPPILGYTAWAYWVFRGKAGEGGYH